jgi:RHS repeat-associated protein
LDANFYVYGPGNMPTCEGTSTTPLGYDGQYTSSDTGLIYLRAREYDQAIAQFPQRRPAPRGQRRTLQLRGNNPLNEGDPTGLSFGLPSQSVVVDDVTREVVQVGAPGFKFEPGSGDLP